MTDLLLASIGLICSLSSGMVNRPKRKLPTPLNHGHDPDDEVGDFGGSLKIRIFQILLGWIPPNKNREVVLYGEIPLGDHFGKRIA